MAEQAAAEQAAAEQVVVDMNAPHHAHRQHRPRTGGGNVSHIRDEDNYAAYRGEDGGRKPAAAQKYAGFSPLPRSLNSTAWPLSTTCWGFPTGIDKRIKIPNPSGARTGGENGEGNGSGREWEEHSSQRIVGAVNPQWNCPFKDEANPRDGHCIPVKN
jgi:hypothetical protein